MQAYPPVPGKPRQLATARRGIGAVVAGLVLVVGFFLGADALLSAVLPSAGTVPGRPAGPPPFLALGFTALVVIAGSFVAARLAPARPIPHALGLGVLLVLLGLIAAFTVHATAPAWYHVAVLLLILPCAWFGGRLREREVSYPAARASTIIGG
jgi:hypothetical protein